MSKKFSRRPKGGIPFVRLHHWMMNSPAWQSLTPRDRVLYLEIAKRYFGNNNGRIGLGVRDAAAATNMDKDTCGAGFKELEAKGFIERKTPGYFKARNRKVTEWLMTEHPDDVNGDLPKKTFMRWKPP